MRTLLRVDPDAPLVRPKREALGSVSIESFAFQPARVEVPVGTGVTWTNEDPTEHTVTAADGAFGSDPLSPQARFAFTFDQPGTFPYRCAIHPAMTGTVTVRTS
jgi:plastocyanin